jgi:hypothetical protein
MNLLKAIPFHTFILAACGVLSAISQAKQEVLPEEMLIPLILVEAYALVVLLLCLAVLRKPKQAGIAASFIVGLTFCFDQFRKILDGAAQAVCKQDLPAFLTFALFWFVVLGAVSLIFRRPRLQFENQAEREELEVKLNAQLDAQFSRMHIAFNLMCTVLLALNMIPLAVSEVEQTTLQRQFVEQFTKPFAGLFSDAAGGATTSAAAAAGRPDVYYIILDAFAAHDTLKEFGNYDNSEFIDFLKSKGFFVASKTSSNYDRTPLSLSSSMNMQYINAVPEKLGENYIADNIYYRLIQRGAVITLFKRLGYKIVNLSSGSFATDALPEGDYNLRCDFGNHFTTAMLMLTPLLAVESYLPLMRDSYCARRLGPKYLLPEALKLPSPKFVLVHTDLPHPPSLFDENGKKLPLPRLLLNDSSTDFAPYVGQLKFCQKEAKEWIELLLSQPGPKPIIIVQSDHGPYFPMPEKERYFNEVMRIINAYYFPDPVVPGRELKDGLYDEITPVNSFRVLFNDYFKAGLPLLEDKSYCSPVRVNPYRWSDVKPLLHFSK